MKRIFFALAIFVFPLVFFACNYGLPPFLFHETGVEDRAESFVQLLADDLPQAGALGKYSFLLLSDSHFGNERRERKEEEFLALFKTLLSNPDQSLRPRFIVNLGDTLDGGHSSEADFFNRTAATWILAAKDALGVDDYKIYSILGNHDLYNNGWEVWKERIWPYNSCYAFSLNAGGASTFDFLFLDTGNGTLGAPQIEDLERRLKNSANPKIVFMHYPVYAGGIFYFALGDVSERARLISDFAAGNVKYVFEGHKHSILDCDLKNFKEAVVGSYLENHVVALVTVDENAQSVSAVRYKY